MNRGERMLSDPAASEAVGAEVASVLRVGDVVLLEGQLGAGKTSIARGLLAALGLQGEAPSPSFAIVQPVEIDVKHRQDDPSEMPELGLDDALYDSALVVEWPDRAGPGAWPDALRLALSIEPDGARRLTWEAPAAWERRWPSI